MFEEMIPSILEKELDLEMNKCISGLSIGYKFLDVYMVESQRTGDPVAFMESSLEDFKTKALELIKKAYETLKKFFKDFRISLNTKVQQFQLNKKLEELKDIMAKKKSKALNKKVDYFDVKKYKQYYTDFINRYTAELKKGLNKDFKTVDEYEKWRVDMLNKLSDFNFKLSDEEQWKLSVSINSAIELTEEEAKNREKNLQMVEEDGSRAIKGIEDYYKTLSPERSFVNYNDHKLKIFSLQNSFIGYVLSQLTKAIKTIVTFITKHMFLCVTTLLVLLVAL